MEDIREDLIKEHLWTMENLGFFMLKKMHYFIYANPMNSVEIY
jgi:hypothetical protein